MVSKDFACATDDGISNTPTLNPHLLLFARYTRDAEALLEGGIIPS